MIIFRSSGIMNNLLTRLCQVAPKVYDGIMHMLPKSIIKSCKRHESLLILYWHNHRLMHTLLSTSQQTPPRLCWVSHWWQTVAVLSVDTNWALIVVLEEPEVGVVGVCQASNASAGADEAWADVDGVCVTRLHVNGWEGRERTWCWLVVPGGLRAGA